MYTGITQGLAVVTLVQKKEGLFTYTVKFNESLIKHLVIGASISVDGVCQTVVAIHHTEITFQAIDETCRKTTLKNLKVGQVVSIERSATVGTEIGGHPMYGHIYGEAEIIKKEIKENNLKLIFQGSSDMMHYIFEKGFIGINGSSLTLCDVDFKNKTFAVNLIPHTLAVTDFKNKKIGDKVNIEVDAHVVIVVETLKRMNKKNPIT